MVRNKETFEQWSNKKRPNNPLSSSVFPEPSRVPSLTASTMRTQIDSGDKLRGKGMKRTNCNPNSFPPPAGVVECSLSPTNLGTEEAPEGIDLDVRNVQGKEATTGTTNRVLGKIQEVAPSIDSGTGSPEFVKHQRKEKPAVAAWRSMDKDDEREQRGRSRAWSKEKNIMSKNPENGRETGIRRGLGTSSRRRSRSSSTASLGQHNAGRKRRTVVSKGWRGNRMSSPGEEEFERHSHKKQSSRTEWRRSSLNDYSGREGRGDKKKKRHQCNSGSSQSASENYTHQRERSMVVRGRAYSRNGNYKDNNREDDWSPLPSVETDCSKSSQHSHRQRRRKLTDSSSKSASEVPTDDDDVGILEVKSETTLRKERRDRQKIRERQVRSREKQGHKAYYLHVNHNGKPYGDGFPAWKSDLNKLSRTLDPSVMDVREQPPTEMSTLRRRLRQNFDYSHPVDPIHIRQLVGRAITQWRNTLWKKMDAGQSCPKGFDSVVWSKLERTRSCPSHNEKSERMKHANSCRITLRRTGPRGEEGIRELLRSQKGVSPDYNDVFTEMQRDKGYGGKAAEKKELMKAKQNVVVEGEATELWKSVQRGGDKQSKMNMCPSTSRAKNIRGDAMEDEYIQGLLFQIAELQAAVAVTAHGASGSREGSGVQKCVDNQVELRGTDQLFVEQEEEAHVGQEGSTGGGIASCCPGRTHPISKGNSEVDDVRLKLQLHKGL